MSSVRKRLRLRGYDYARPGATFVTVCLDPRLPLLGRVEADGVLLTQLGEIVLGELRALTNRFSGVEVDEHCVMPDHMHAVLVIGVSIPLSSVVGAFKSVTARRVNQVRGTPGGEFWQRSFHDHLVRDEDDLARCREYIASNPARWRATRS